jgi:hypothetical protein
MIVEVGNVRSVSIGTSPAGELALCAWLTQLVPDELRRLSAPVVSLFLASRVQMKTRGRPLDCWLFGSYPSRAFHVDPMIAVGARLLEPAISGPARRGPWGLEVRFS